PTFARPEESGPGTGRSSSRISWRAGRCATSPGGGGSPWRNSFPQRGRGAATWRSPASTGPARCRRSSPRTSTIRTTPRGIPTPPGLGVPPPAAVGGPPAPPPWAAPLVPPRRYELAWVRERFTAGGASPDCGDCGGYIKTATISFGQPMPEAPMRRAEEFTLSCDLFLAIGSSLVVWPAAGFPLMAKPNGAKLVILNRDATEFDGMADLVIHEDIGTVLAPFVAH